VHACRVGRQAVALTAAAAYTESSSGLQVDGVTSGRLVLVVCVSE
jgi:hypothetical protein